MNSCIDCDPGIECVYIGKDRPFGQCPWYKARNHAAPRGATMVLRITGEGDATWLQLRLCCNFVKEADGQLYEVWSSPDFPMPEPMISEILTFLEQHVCAPVSQDKAITKATIPASLIAKLMGPEWMSRFCQLATAPAAPAALDGPGIIDVESEPA